jgi:hypothetical protein
MEQIRFFACVGAGGEAIAHLSYNNYFKKSMISGLKYSIC